jgi:hypothetical protein
MGSFSDFLENELLDHLFNTGAYTPPTIYVGLCTADPTDAGTGANCNEVANSGSYARVAHSSWDAAASRLTENTGTITFPEATGSWGTVTHYAIFDSVTYGAGNMLAHGALNDPKSIVSGNTASIADGKIEISFSAAEGLMTYLANKLLDHVFGNGSYSTPTLRFALSTTTPSNDGTGITEPSGNNYSRVDDYFGGWDAAASGATENTGAITFDTPSGSWGLITHVLIYDNEVTPNPLLYGTVPNQTPDNGDTVQFAAGALDVTLS